MADDFKALVALTKETNAKLDLLHRQGSDNDSPRERILDAAPEILSMERVMKKEKTQRDKIHKEDQKNRDKGEKSTVQAVKETAKGTSKPIVEVIKKDIVSTNIFNDNLLTSIDSGNMKLIGSSTLGSEKIALSLNGFTKDSKSFKEILKSVRDYLDKPMPLAKSGAKFAEDRAKEGKDRKKMNELFSSMNNSLKGIASAGFAKIKSGFSGLAKFALGGLALAALAFLNDPVFQKIAFDFTEYIIPKLAYIYKE